MQRQDVDGHAIDPMRDGVPILDAKWLETMGGQHDIEPFELRAPERRWLHPNPLTQKPPASAAAV